MKETPSHITLVDPGERLPLPLAGSVLYYRRLSLGQLAALERQQALSLAGQAGAPARIWIPPAALEAAMVAQVLVGWQGVLEPRTGREAQFTPQTAQGLPAAARAPLLRAARRLHPPPEESS